MDFAWLIPLLALFTILAALCLALKSKKDTEARRRMSHTTPSSLAADGDPHVKAP